MDKSDLQAIFGADSGRPVYFSGSHDFTDLIVDRTRDFTGREWVFAELEGWLTDAKGSRIFFIGELSLHPSMDL